MPQNVGVPARGRVGVEPLKSHLACVRPRPDTHCLHVHSFTLAPSLIPARRHSISRDSDTRLTLGLATGVGDWGDGGLGWDYTLNSSMIAFFFLSDSGIS